jgi:hypothetical protein
MGGLRTVAIFLAGAGFLGAPLAAQAPAAPPAAVAPVLEDGAWEALERVQAFLQAVPLFELRADVVTEEVYNSGQKIMYGQRLTYMIERPNHMRLDFQSELMARRIYFNGTQTVISEPRLGYYAQFDKVGTIKDLFEAAETNLGIELPLADLFLWGSKGFVLERPQSGFYVGPAQFGGIRTEHYAYRKPGIDFQIWIQEGEVPLPIKLVITDTSDPAQPSYVALLSWNLSPKFTASTFTFTPGPKDIRIPFKPLRGQRLAAPAPATPKE